jgi:hypothetical protein
MTSEGLIALAISAYGERASASAFADFLEICAMRSREVSFSGLDEAIRDHGWANEYRSLDISTQQDELPVSWSDSVISLVRERSVALGGSYPFRIGGAYIVSKRGASPRGRVDYLRLLRLTAAHAYGYKGRPAPDSIFEKLVSGALQRRGLASASMGTGSRSTKGFTKALSEAGNAVGVRTSADPLPRQRFARDGKVDALSAMSWGDGRPGHFTWLTQATVGESSTWIVKLKEPDAEIWRGVSSRGAIAAGDLGNSASRRANASRLPTCYEGRHGG